jgi:hypothetical protein
MATEETIGIEKDGFKDPSRVFPRKQYINVASTNLAARGIIRNELYLGGGDQGISLDLNDTLSSQYPYNQVRETISGHVTEIDDTPGNERMLFKHRTGAGIELRADGTVIVSSVNNTIRISGGDEKVIVEGDGEISYNGNLTLNVSGDFDLRVGGDFNVQVSGDEDKDVRGSKRTKVHRNQESTIKKNNSAYILGTDTETVYGNKNSFIRSNLKQYIEGNTDQYTGGILTMTAEDEVVLSSPNINIGASSLTVIGDSGTFGGDEIVYYGKTAHIDRVNTTSTHSTAMYATTFHGSLNGKASFAAAADQAGSAPLGPGSGGGSQTIDNTEATNKTTVEVDSLIIDDYLNLSNKGVRRVSLDNSDILRNQIDKTVDYGGVSAKRLTTPEVRSKLRDPLTLANKKFVGAQIAEGKLSPAYVNSVPPSIGRTVPNEGGIKRGFTPIGNSSRGRSKRFTK